MLAIVIPGIGYHKDKPLLYYSIKLAKAAGYEIKTVDFSGIVWERGDLRDPAKMLELFQETFRITEEELSKLSIDPEEEVLFITKSIGTAVATRYAEKHGIRARHIFFSPVEQFLGSPGGIAFSGDNDPLADYEKIEKICAKTGTELHRIPGGNHSLETGDVMKDVEMLQKVLERVRKFIFRDI